MEFALSFWPNSGHFTARMSANIIGHVSEVELYRCIISTTLEKFLVESDSFTHKISVGPNDTGTLFSPIVDIDRFF